MAQEEIQHHSNQERPFQEILEDRGQCRRNEPGAVIEGDYLYTFGQDRGVEGFDTFFQRGEHL